MDVTCCCASDDSETDCHAEGGTHEHFPAAENVVEAGARGSEDPARDSVDCVEEQLSVGICYTDVFDEKGEILDLILVGVWIRERA